MESFSAALGVVFPMLVMMSAGAILRRASLADGPTVRRVDAINFRLFLPCLLFINIYRSDLSQDFNAGTLLFALAAYGLLLGAVLLIVPRLVHTPERTSVVCQAIVRGNFVLFGLSITEYIYGEGHSGTAALLAAIMVPLMNVTAVVLLEYFRPGGGQVSGRRLLLGVVKNPLIIASLLALALVLSPLRLPEMIASVITSMSRVATPLAFTMLGATLSLEGFQNNRRILLWTVLTRMFLVPLLALTAAVLLGFRGAALTALMVLFASPTAVSSFSMAQQMGADGELAAQLVALTSIVSLGTIFFITFLFQSLGLL